MPARIGLGFFLTKYFQLLKAAAQIPSKPPGGILCQQVTNFVTAHNLDAVLFRDESNLLKPSAR